MWHRLKTPLIALSVGLNLAFIAMWIAQTVPELSTGSKPATNAAGDGPDFLHRTIGVTSEQWRQIEPHIRQFRKNAQTQRRTISALRMELMELLAASGLDERRIRAKQEQILTEKSKMQNQVIELLLLEKRILKPEQQKALIGVIHGYCSGNETGDSPGPGLGQVLRSDESAFGKDHDDK
ncbi:MAG: periplasmic heavy metal sensor [Desulfohalobiaceae bacterium]|nr:periplasmic heavy metal sensor [Desulfohalobiaceae bacterium]